MSTSTSASMLTNAAPHEVSRLPLVSIVMPIRNEADHIERALDAIDAQAYPPEQIEILVVDGGSTDGTLEALRVRAGRDDRIRVLGGPGINTPLAMNVGIEASSAPFIAKVDGHGWINEEFLRTAVGSLTSDEGLGCVGGRIEPDAVTAVEQAIGYARFSVLGVGAGVYTLAEHPQLTDTVQCGVYRRVALEEAGGFDPALPFGEDEEANYRLRSAGWRILMDPAMRFVYRVRPSIAALFRQYFRYGRARVAVVRKHPGFFRPKHAVPAAVVVALFASLAAWFAGAPWPALVPWIVYGVIVSVGSVVLAVRHRFWRPDLIAVSLLALHGGYGLGTLRGLADAPRSGS